MKKAILILIITAICSISYSQEFLPKHNYYVLWQMLEKDSIPMEKLFDLNLKVKTIIAMDFNRSTNETQIFKAEYNIEDQIIDFPRIVASNFEVHDTLGMPEETLWRWEIKTIGDEKDTKYSTTYISRGGKVLAHVSPPVGEMQRWLIFFADESVNELLPIAQANP